MLLYLVVLQLTHIWMVYIINKNKKDEYTLTKVGNAGPILISH